MASSRQIWALVWARIGPIFFVAGFIVCPPPEIDFEDGCFKIIVSKNRGFYGGGCLNTSSSIK
jgi:hypothetical protein